MGLRDDLDQCSHFTLKKIKQEEHKGKKICVMPADIWYERIKRHRGKHTKKGEVLEKGLTYLRNGQNSDYYTILKRHPHSYVHCSIIHNSPNMEIT